QMVVRLANPLPGCTVITNASYSIDSNETSAVTGGAVATVVSNSSAPTVASAFDVTTNSIYVLRPGAQVIQINGTAFQQGAALTLGTGITSGPTTFIDATHLEATITVDPAAALGPCTVTVTNPD